jgi:hypothetical protein
VIGIAIFIGPLSKGWTITLIIAALFYGLFGVFRLGVLIDIILLVALIPLGWQLAQHFHFRDMGMLTGIKQRVEK